MRETNRLLDAEEQTFRFRNNKIGIAASVASVLKQKQQNGKFAYLSHGTTELENNFYAWNYYYIILDNFILFISYYY